MEEKKLRGLSDQELLEKRKKAKSTQMMNAVILGVIVGITVYSTVKNGFSLLTVLLLFFAVIAFNNWRNVTTSNKESKPRSRMTDGGKM